MVRPVVHSTKHPVQFPIDTIVTATRENLVIAKGVLSTNANLATEVVEGTLVKAVFIEMWTLNSSNDGHEILILEKVPQGGSGATFANMADLFNYQNKKNILHTHEGLTNNDGIDPPRQILGQWFKIPKGKQRMGLGDSIVITLSNPSSGTLTRCGFATYKEYS